MMRANDALPPPIATAWRYVSHPTDSSACWTWHGRFAAGYGHFNWRHQGRVYATSAHRVIWHLTYGAWPAQDLHHHCHNRSCVNPSHLEPLTRREHSARHMGDACHRGHPFTPENTYWRPRGDGRNCRRCQASRNEAYRERRREES